MNDALKIQISAFVDGELPGNEAELLLRRLGQDGELRSMTAQYLAIGRAIRGETEPARMASLRARIAGALGEETPPAAPEATELVANRFMRPLVGVAVAASVAVLGLLGLRQVGPNDETLNPALGDLAALAIDEAPLYTEPPADEFMSDRPSEMLSRYFQHHNERSADLGANSILSRLVNLELREGELVRVDAPGQSDAVGSGPDAAADNSRPPTAEPGDKQ